MAVCQPGSFMLCCRASLEHPRRLCEEDKFGVIDALIFASRAVNHSSMISCTLRFPLGENTLNEGIYDICANHIHVVAYCEEIMSTTAMESTNYPKLMGDIVDVKPVPVLAEDPIAACKIAARVIGSGMVSSVDKETHSFFLFPSQIITANADPEALPVRAVLEKSPKWPEPTARLPSPHSFVAFTGKLAQFKDNITYMKTKLLYRAVVSLDSITYLRANYGTHTTPSTSSSLQPHAVSAPTKSRGGKPSQGKMCVDFLKGKTSKFNADFCGVNS
ncbi:hypothetical protein V8E53_008102 [Lactarius tabidus]